MSMTMTNVRAAQSMPLAPSARKVLRNTYLLLAMTMLPSIVGAVVGVQMAPALMAAGSIIFLVMFLGVLFGVQYMIVRNSDSMAGVGWLLLFTFAMGFFLGPLLTVALSFKNGVELISMAFGGTAAIFFVLAGFASTTNRNLYTPGFGKLLFVGMITVFVVSIIGFFFSVPALSLALSSVMMLVAAGFILYTINGIVRGGETNYILATLTVYIMLYNLFTSMLHLLMAFAGNRE
jgi:FtsH-binding integral membrane protein